MEEVWLRIWWFAAPLTSTLFVFAFGACTGSFINVVVHRLPQGMSLRSPPSRCPSCGRPLAWHENLPIVGWFLVRGRCRTCGSRVGIQYPLVEFLVGLLFGAAYFLYFETRFGPGFGGVTNPWWVDQGPFRAAPAFIALLALIGSLVAASLIDAKQYVIPAEITTFATVTGVAGLVVQAFMPESIRAATSEWWAVPLPGWFGTAAGIAGVAGLIAAWILLRLGVLKPSFADYDEYVAPGATLADYPHARREMVRELVFLGPCVVGLATVIFLQPTLESTPQGAPPLWLAALGASCLGIVVGGGMLWAIRILGSIAFGREAMGMGDVHLMAAVGAVAGWAVPVVAFIPAVFVALGCTLAIRGLAVLRRRSGRELPLGPYLAVGVLLIIFFRPVFVEGGRWIAPALIPEDLPGLFTNDPRSGGIPNGAAESARRGPVRAGNRF